MDAAVLEFASFGYEGARIDRIARGAGLNKRLMYYYFGDKETLFAEAVTAVRRQLDSLVEAPPANDDPLARLRSLLEAGFTYIARSGQPVHMFCLDTAPPSGFRARIGFKFYDSLREAVKLCEGARGTPAMARGLYANMLQVAQFNAVAGASKPDVAAAAVDLLLAASGISRGTRVRHPNGEPAG